MPEAPEARERWRRIEAILDQVLETAPERRSARLDRLCAGDPELRSEVEELLRADRHAGEFMAAPAAEGAADLLGETLRLGGQEATTLGLSGRTVGPYALGRRLGAGGMGVVYEAEDTRLKRRVALKFLPPEVSRDPAAKERFLREARAASALDHPGICTIHDLGETDDGQLYFVMAYYRGETLQQRLEQGPLKLADARRIAIQVARGLEHAHDAGITHRDVKPANVILTESGEAKILDFGVARVGGATVLTQPGTSPGTPAYMSPEQSRGEPTDGRTDLWSLGVVLYEMLAGRRPFGGDNPLSVMNAIATRQPEALEALRPEVPDDLAAIVRKLLSKEPADRFAGARELLEELDLGSRATGATVDGVPRPGRRPGRRTWWPALAAAAAALAIVSLSILWPKAGVSPQVPDEGTAAVAPTRKMIAVLPFENLGPPEDRHFTAGMTEEITSRLTEVGDLGVISRGSADRYGGTDKPTRQVGEELGVEYLLGGTVRWAQAPGGGARLRITPRLIDVAADSQIWSKSFDRTYDDVLTIQSEIASAVVAELGVTLPGPEREIVEARLTDVADAYRLYLKALDRRTGLECRSQLQRIADLDRAVALDPGFAKAWSALALSHARYFHFCRAAEDRRNQARRALDRAMQLAPASVDTIYAAGVYTLRVERDYDGALTWIRSMEDKSGRSAELLTAEAVILRRQARWREAIDTFERARRLDPRSVELAHMLAGCHAHLRQYPQAVASYDRAIALGSKSGSEWQRKAQIFWLWRGDTRAARGVLEAVPPSIVDDGTLSWAWYWQEIYEGHPERALERLAQAPHEWIRDSIDRWPKAMAAAFAHRFAGDGEAAREAFEQAREVLLAEIARAPADARLRRALSLAHAGLGRKEDALADADRAIGQWPLEEHPWFGIAPLMNLALVHTTLGERDQALDLVARLLAMPSLISIPMLELDPRWASLREHPRFAELKRKRASMSTG